MDQKHLLCESQLSNPWRDLSSSAPEVVVPTDKEAAKDEGKEVAPGHGPEVIQQEHLPEVIGADGDKEVAFSKSRNGKAKPAVFVTWLKDHKRSRWSIAVVSVLVVLAIALSAGLGIAMRRKDSDKAASKSTSDPMLYDASVIPSPTSGRPPTGTYALALGQPQETQADCLSKQAQRAAWDCNISPYSALGLVVQDSAAGQLNGRIFDASYNDSVAYGAQLNYMNTTAANFMTVRDNDDPSNGPAFYFQQFFDKVVVVPENAIQSSSTKLRRRRTTAEPGEKPWLCVWNNTLLEGFIYINKAADTSSSMTTTTSSTTQDPSATESQPSDLVTTTMTFEWTTATVTAPASQLSGFASEFSEASASTSTVESTATPTSTILGKREIPSSDLWSSLELFPLLVKLEERRLANNTIQPYCQQYQILDSGVANWIGDENGNPIIINLDESDPPASAYTATSTTKNRRAVSGECHCQWLSGSGA